MMPVGVSHIARRAQPKIKTILFRDALFITIEDAGDFFRKRRRFRTKTEGLMVAHLVVRHAHENRSRDQKEQRECARYRRHARAQINGTDSFFSSYNFHL